MAAPPSGPCALVVGIGASAGGLDAFKRFLASTLADTGMAFVLVQHLDPHHKSLLVELLGAHSPIPVVAAKDGLAVKQNCVFVIPPDATLTIKDGVLRLTTPAPAREYRRPIDTFFKSLAEDCGERAVGIVLAGVGSDGTIGIRTIKDHGGLTMAKAEVYATAMPGTPSSAAATGLVDHVVPIDAMPGKLIDYQKYLVNAADKKGGDGHRRDLHEHLEKIISLLHARSEHDFSGYKETTLMRRVQRRMQVLHIDSAADYLERLRTDKGEAETLFRELLIGVTEFFRDPQALEARWLPVPRHSRKRHAQFQAVHRVRQKEPHSAATRCWRRAACVPVQRYAGPPPAVAATAAFSGRRQDQQGRGARDAALCAGRRCHRPQP